MSSAREAARLVMTVPWRTPRVLTSPVSPSIRHLWPPAGRLFQNPVNFFGSTSRVVVTGPVTGHQKQDEPARTAPSHESHRPKPRAREQPSRRDEQRMHMNLAPTPVKGRVIIVTGASSGIG